MTRSVGARVVGLVDGALGGRICRRGNAKVQIFLPGEEPLRGKEDAGHWRSVLVIAMAADRYGRAWRNADPDTSTARCAEHR